MMPIGLPDGRTLSDEVMEALRSRAIRARMQGYSVREIADILGVRIETVYRWCSAYDSGGEEALPQGRTGRPIGAGAALNENQTQRIRHLINEHCPDELGIASALWTRRAVKELIEKEFSIRLSVRTVGKYLRRWGYTPQKPVRKSYKQDPKEVQQWLEIEYPKIKLRAEAEGAEIHWGDETGVRSTCHVGRGYAPKGETPELKLPGNRFSVNMISTVTNQGKVRFMIYEGRMTAALFIAFLARLIRYADTKIFLIVDNLSLHDAIIVREWVVDRNDQIELFFLPKYAPELNPDEYLNCDLKAGVNAGGLPTNREHLKANLMSFMRRLAKLPARVASYFQNRHIHYAAANAIL